MSLAEMYKVLEEENKALLKENEKYKNASILLNKRKRKRHFNSSRVQQHLNKVQIKTDLQKYNEHLLTIGLQIDNLTIVDEMENHNDFQIDILSDGINNDQDNILARVTLYKDHKNMSDHSYHDFRLQFNLDKKLPTIYNIKKYRAILDGFFTTQHAENGCYVDVVKKLEFTLKNIYRRLEIKDDFEFIIKICGDGTNLGQSGDIKLFNLNFSVINDKENCKTAKGHYTIGIYEIEKEEYEEVSECILWLFEALQNFKHITIDGKNIRVKFRVGGDYKFLALCMGVNKATSNYPCIYCTVRQENFHDTVSSIRDPKRGARSDAEAEKCMNLKENDAKLGYINKKLSIGIPYEDHVFDMLHMYIRVSGTLINLLLTNGILVHDAINENENCKKKFIKFMKEECGIKNPLCEDAKGTVKVRNLTGPQFNIIHDKIDILSLFGEIADVDIICELWRNFIKIYNGVKENKIHYEEVKTNCMQWLSAFLSIYSNDNITPYIHLFTCHLYEHVEIHGDVNAYNQQGHEKLNDITTGQFYRGTNKNRDFNEFLRQLICKRNRIEILTFLLSQPDEYFSSFENFGSLSVFEIEELQLLKFITDS